MFDYAKFLKDEFGIVVEDDAMERILEFDDISGELLLESSRRRMKSVERSLYINRGHNSHDNYWKPPEIPKAALPYKRGKRIPHCQAFMEVVEKLQKKDPNVYVVIDEDGGNRIHVRYDTEGAGIDDHSNIKDAIKLLSGEHMGKSPYRRSNRNNSSHYPR